MNEPAPLLLCDVEVDGRVVDVFVAHGRVEAIGRSLALPGAVESIDGCGGALLPGLHDHHVHLLAMAAAAASVDISGLDRDAAVTAMLEADRSLPGGAWMRVVGYHEAAMGEVDHAGLDAVVPARPVRVQHATGGMWVCNSAGLAALPIDRAPGDRVERDAGGAPTGRLFGLDDWLFRHLPPAPPDLARVAEQLAGFGITGVTDATPYERAGDLAHLRAAVATGAVPQRVVITGRPTLDRRDLEPLVAGPAKIVVDDYAPPGVDALAEEIAIAHRDARPVALHCASRLGVVLGVAALEQAGSRGGDRIEHGAVVPPELFDRLRALAVTIVTQPAFVYARGDRYLTDVEPEDVPHLWRCGSFLAAGIPVGFGSDAPHGPADPWLAMRAATQRRTRAGRALGLAEAVDATTALARLLSAWDEPGGPPRRVTVGGPADLCLLRAPLAEARREPSSELVELTLVGGTVV